MSLLNYSTKIPPEQTIGEIQKMLSEYGVQAMMTEYDGRNVSAVSFKMNVNGKSMGFKMPCNWRAVFDVMRQDTSIPRALRESEDQSIKVAWRIIHTWVKSQLALVEVNMVTIPQVFLPYAIMKDGKTLSEHVESNPQFLLNA